MRALGTKSTTYSDAPVELGMTQLPTESLDFGDRHTRHAQIR